MKGIAPVLLFVILLLGCRKDIQNKEAVRQGVADYLAKRTDLMAMDISVSNVTFRNKEADAIVYLKAKSGPAAGNGMQIRYLLEQNNNRWVVKGRPSAAGTADPHGSGPMNMPPEGSPHGGSPALPPGHPVVPSSPSPGPSK